MAENRKKDFITRLAVKNLKGKLNIIKDKSPRERISELYKMIHSLNSDQINALKTDLKKFTPELTALRIANRRLRDLIGDDEMITFATEILIG